VIAPRRNHSGGKVAFCGSARNTRSYEVTRKRIDCPNSKEIAAMMGCDYLAPTMSL